MPSASEQPLDSIVNSSCRWHFIRGRTIETERVAPLRSFPVGKTMNINFSAQWLASLQTVADATGMYVGMHVARNFRLEIRSDFLLFPFTRYSFVVPRSRGLNRNAN